MFYHENAIVKIKKYPSTNLKKHQNRAFKDLNDAIFPDILNRWLSYATSTPIQRKRTDT